MAEDVAELRVALTETEARLETDQQRPGGGPFTFIRKWQYIDAVYGESLVKSAPQYVINPYVDGNAQVGPYEVKRQWGEAQDDRTVTIFQKLGVYPDDHSFYSRMTGLGDDRTYLYSDRPTPVAAPADSQGQIYDAENSISADGTLNSRLVASLSAQASVELRSRSTAFRVNTDWVYKNQRTIVEAPVMAGSGAYDATAEINRDLTYDERLTYTGSAGNAGIEFASLSSKLQDDTTNIYKDRAAPIAAPDDSQGIVYIADNEITDLALYNSRLRKQVSAEATVQILSRATPFKLETEWVYKNLRAKVDAPLVATGAYNAAADINTDLTYDERLTYTGSAGNAGTEFISLQSTLKDDTTYLYKDMAYPLVAPADALGTVCTADNELTELGLYNGRIRREVSTPAQVAFVSRQTAFRVGTDWVYENSTAKIVAPTVAGSGIYDATNRFNQDGTYNQVLHHETGNNNGQIVFVSEENALRQDTTYLYKDMTSFVAAPANTQGTIYRASNAMTDIGTYNSNMEKLVARFANVYFYGAYDFSNNVYVNRFENDINKHTAPNATDQGRIYQVDQQINADLTYSGSEREINSTRMDAYTYWQTVGGVDFIYRSRNVRDLAGTINAYSGGLLASTEPNTVDFSINDDLTYNLAIVHNNRNGTGGTFWPATDWQYKTKQTRKKPGYTDTSQQRDVTWHRYHKYFGTAVDAASYINGGYNTHFQRINNVIWLGIYDALDSFGAWADI